MTTNNTGGRLLAIAAGVVFASAAIAILFEDVILHGAPIALKHYLTLVTVCGTILAGHLSVEAGRHWHLPACLGFAMIFVAGTCLIVYTSVGRQAAVSMQSEAEITDAADKRAHIKPRLERAEKMLAEAQADLARECKTGRGKRCEGIQATIGVYEAAIRGHKAELDALGPPKPVDAEAERFGTVAAFFGFDKEKTKAAAILIEPFVKTLLAEFGTIVGFGYGFRPRRRRKVAVNSDRWPSQSDTDQTSFPVPADPAQLPKFSTVDAGNGGNSGNGGGRRVCSRDEAEADLVTRLALGETVASQDELAARWGVDKSTVSKWLRRWEAGGLIPARQQIGRCKQLARAD